METQASHLLELIERAEALIATLDMSFKGDLPGHEFHGNQYTEGGGSGGEVSDSDGGSGGDTVLRMGIAESTARESGIDPSRIEYGGDGYSFSVGDDNFIAAGQFDPSTGKITLYRSALRDEATIKDVTAHESQHAKYNDVMNEYHTEVRAILNDSRNTIEPSGKVRVEYRGEFQTYSAIQPYIEGRAKELIKKDGITPYSSSYWKAYKDGKVHFDVAVNETLAEVASQKSRGINVGIPTVWRQMYNDVDVQYHRIKRLKK
jgi:hypothetical protein